MNTTDIAIKVMKSVERRPVFSEKNVGELNEVFNHRAFLDADKFKRNAIMLKSSQSKYKDECDYPFDNYFGFDLRPLLKRKNALDLGCFTGGRSVAWLERYEIAKISGIDVKQEYIQAATQFAAKHNANSEFIVSHGEKLPFDDESFDAVLSFDTLEHVKNVQDTLSECYRVLKQGGRLFVVFPSYYHPIEHHLSLATMAPCIHWIFSGNTLIEAYSEILDQRGDEAYWYKRSSRRLESWEKGNTINGMTFAQFKKILANQHWRIFREVHKPIGAIGRNMEGNVPAKILSKLFIPLTYIPGLQELFLHRNTFVLEK